ncbi:Translation initiation factor IF-2 [Frankliniella fusca]|uniref:Translation initiation factor IF-2 n=1 Tax=Frankliniella fusca TaxID=407009 RepID=A0AAE1LBY4_9NEOP|nr:Translation initiation factor IF-2 [Frankliniella fusca]
MWSLLLTLAAALALTAPNNAAAEASWNWPDGQQRPASSTASTSAPAAPTSRDSSSVTGRRFADVPGGRPRYEIVDPDSDDFTLPHPEDLLPNRPLSRPPPPNRPFENNYPLLNPNPGYRPPPPPPRPLPSLGPLGPVVNRPPPGADRYDRTDVSKCKCVHAFNCESNALQFGSCDAGKRYCCTKEPRSLGPRPGGYGANPAVGAGYYGKPAILTGPGGPTGPAGFGPVKDDRFDRYPSSSPYDRYPGSGSSPFDRYPAGSGASPYDRYPGGPGPNPGVLVGPRPTPYRPDPAAGFAPTRPGEYPIRGLNSPYRDYDGYNRGYGLGGRS